MATISCPHCGVSNRSGSNYCNHCGKRLTSVNDAETQSERRSESESFEQTTADTHTLDVQPRQREPNQQDSVPSTAQPAEREFIASDSDVSREQPWLQPEPEPGVSEFVQHQMSTESSEEIRGAARLLTGVQGLIDPLAIAPVKPTAESDKSQQQPTKEANQQPLTTAPAMPELEDADIRFWRQVMQREPVQRTESLMIGAHDRIVLRIPWIFGLLGLCIGIPLLLQFGGPVGQPQQLTGVSDAFQVVEDLSPNALVLIYWAYDPATAGEMDMIAQPVIYHLLIQNSQLVLVSLLPGGPASARRLLHQIENETDVRFISPQPIDSGYLPGGATILPLFAYNLTHVLAPILTEATGDSIGISVGQPNPLERQNIRPALSLVLAANAEDAQEWLEQVQPLTSEPLIAVVSAGADPILRPYLDSGQLSGLVSGFDGASVYQAFLSRPEQLFDQTRAVGVQTQEIQTERIQTVDTLPNDQIRRHLIAQNWGQLAFIVVIIFGNLALLTSRRSEEKDHTMQSVRND